MDEGNDERDNLHVITVEGEEEEGLGEGKRYRRSEGAGWEEGGEVKGWLGKGKGE